MDLASFLLRLNLLAVDPIHFPPAKAANTLRGALGLALDAALFSPHSLNGPSGLADSPRPFVFRARHLDGQTIQPGQTFHFDLNIFSSTPGLFEQAVATAFETGLGPGRGRATLLETPPPALRRLSLSPQACAPPRIRIHFLTPTELKHEGHLAPRPDFAILFARIRDRVSTLRRLYGEGPLDLDYRAIGQRAALIRMTRCEIHQFHTERRSTRTGQTHSLGGFTGLAEYEGDLAEFLPWLEAARFTGVGRQAVWGKGEIAVEPC